MSELSILLLTILPLALGAAISPTVLVGIILILSISDRPKLSGIAFYVGAIILLLIVVVAGIILGKGVAVASGRPPSMTSAYIDLAIGIFLILLGIRRVIKKGDGLDTSKFLGKSKSAGSEFIKNMILGVGIFAVNFTTTVLVFAAGKDIGLSSAGFADKLTVIFVLTVITLLVIEIPLFVYFTMPERSEKILEPLNVWMQNNTRYLMAAVMFAFGIYLSIKGIRALF